MKHTNPGVPPMYLACVVVNYESFVPAAEVFVGTNLSLQLLQQRLVRALTFGMHGGTDVIQDTHYTNRILGNCEKDYRNMSKKKNLLTG